MKELGIDNIVESERVVENATSQKSRVANSVFGIPRGGR